MALALDIQPRAGYLHAAINGSYDHVQFRDFYIRILKTAAKSNLPNIVVDCLAMTGKPTDVERLDLAEAVVKYRFEALLAEQPSSYKVALVGPQSTFYSGMVGLEISNQRGGNANVFDRVEDAVKWLGVASA